MQSPTMPKAPFDSESSSAQEAIRRELKRVLGSEMFRRTSGLSGFLRFLVTEDLEGRSGDLKETYIGHHFFGRQASYDPKLDALVRVSANRLRQRLAAFYEDGTAGGVQIDLPRGTYVPTYRWNDAPAEAEEAPGAEEQEEISQPAEPMRQQAALPSAVVSLGAEEHGTPAVLPQRAWWRSVWFAAAAVLLLTAALATALANRVWAWRGGQDGEVWEARPLTRLIGVQEFPDFSPDGRSVAFAETPDGGVGQSQIYVMDVQGGEPVRLTDGPGEHTRPAWSPNGQEIAFVWLMGGEKQLRVLSLKSRQVHTIATLQGNYPWLCQLPRLSWTRDGSRIVTTESLAAGGPCRITAVDVRSGRAETLGRGGADAVADVEPALSPDGTRVAFLRNTGTLVGDLYTTDLDGGDLRRLTNDGVDILGFSWDRDGGGLMLSSRRGDGMLRLWHERFGGEPPVRVTDGLVPVGFPAQSPDGRTVVISLYHDVMKVWRVWSNGRPAELLIANQGTNADAQSSPDGQWIVFRSDRSGSTEIWRSDRNGRQPVRLTYFNGPMASRPTWSPDGRQIAMECRDRGHVDVCLIPAGGGQVQHVTNWSSNQERPAWSADGKTLYFVSDHAGRREVFALEQGAASPVQVTQGGATLAMPLWSGAGLLVARDEPVPGLYCSASSFHDPREEDAYCGAGDRDGRVLAEAPRALEVSWAMAPGGAWHAVQGAAEPDETEIVHVDWRTQRSTPMVRFPHALVMGDREMTVDAGGASALVVEQGARGATLDVLRQVRRP